MKISVVIPTYNRVVLLGRTLHTLFWQKDSNYEVLISVDDDAEHYEKTMQTINRFIVGGMPIRTFYTGQYKRGKGWSVETYPYNVGIRHAEGDVVLLNSGDVMSATYNIGQHRMHHSRPYSDKLVLFSTVHGLAENVMAKIDEHPWKEDPQSLLYKGSCELMYCGHGKSYMADLETEDKPRPYHYQMSLKRNVLQYLRGFDEDFYGHMGGGDDDLATRLIKYGCVFHYAPEILAIHQWHVQSSFQTKYGHADTNDQTGEIPPSNFWEKDRQFKPIIRNANHEWGQYPRDMEKLPKMSGYSEEGTS